MVDNGPVLIFSRTGLTNAKHTVRIDNVLDTRFGGPSLQSITLR